MVITESICSKRHKHNMTLPPREAVIYAMSVRWPGELLTLGKLASVSQQSRIDAYEVLQQLYAEIPEVHRQYSTTGKPVYQWLQRMVQ